MPGKPTLPRMAGGCLCGAVRFTAEPENEMDVCHCSMCRRWSAGPFMGVNCGRSVEIENDGNLIAYASSAHGERVFCKSCGTSLFWRMRDGSHTSVSAQAFDDPSIFPFKVEIFIDEQPANYAFAGERKRMTGAEVIAAFQSGGGAA